MFAALPGSIRKIARNKFRLFLKNSNDPALHNHELKATGRGRHRTGSRSVWITQQYRAIYVVERAGNTWYWIGPHSAYNIFTGSNN